MPERSRFENELAQLGLYEFASPKTSATKKWLKLFPDAKRNRAEFLLDGEAYFKSVVDAIGTAKTKKHYIYILGWMLDIDLQLVNGDSSSTLFKLLTKAANRGVEIRILIWDNPTHNYAKLNKDAFQRLNALSHTKVYLDEHTFLPQQSLQMIGKIVPYIRFLLQKYPQLISPILKHLDENKEVPASYYFWLLLNITGILQVGSRKSLGAHHDKVVIVKGDKGLTAFCGGIDFNKNRVISTVNTTEYRFPFYHDNACRLAGPAAYEVLQKFKKRWSNHPIANKTRLLGGREPKPREKPTTFPYAKVVGTYNSPTGNDKDDRSLKDAYLKIIQNAESYIYIEDQYLVNQDVAAVLNKKLKEPNFQKLTFAIQDSIETADILIPNRKRGEFLSVVLDGTTQHQKDKVLLAVLDRTRWDKDRYHPGLHAKTLIVDDEIAIIGSANVNQRSFTCDSETSVVVFDNTKNSDKNFAARLRIATWKEFLRKPVPKIVYESWWNYPTEISSGKNDLSILVKYQKDAQDDLDLKIWSAIKQTGVAGIVAAYKLSGGNLPTTQQLMSQMGIEGIFNIIWEHLIDPVGP